MAASGAQRSLSAAVFKNRKANVIHFRCCSCGCHLEALLGREFFRNRLGVYWQSVVMENAAQFDHLIGGKIQLEQACQLRVAVLLDHVKRSEEHTSELQSPCNLVCR